MKQYIALLLILCLLTTQVYAATTFIWNPSPDIQPTHTQYIGVGSFAGGKTAETYSGITSGVYKNIEIGVDIFGGTLYPFLFNAKYGVSETAKRPAYAVGMCGLGTKHNVTDSNIVYALVARTFQPVCRVTLGGYFGCNEALFIDGETEGNTEREGAIIVLDKRVTKKMTVSTEYASGNNFYGSWTAGMSYAVAQNVVLILGYVKYNNHTLNTEDYFTSQVNITI